MDEADYQPVLIIPTECLINQFLENLSRASNCEYDFNELVAHACTVLECNAPQGIALRAEQLYDLHTNRSDALSGEVISKSWFRFATDLRELYSRFANYDANGFYPYYFKGFQGEDIVLARYPS